MKDVPSISNTGQGVVPSQERREQAKHTARLDAALVRAPGLALAHVHELQVPDGEEEEGEVEGEEEQEEGDGGAEGADQQDGGEDEPAGEVEADGVVQVVPVLVGFADGEAAGGQDDGEGDPEAAVRGERRGSEGVAHGHFPGRCALVWLLHVCVCDGIGMQGARPKCVFRKPVCVLRSRMYAPEKDEE